MPLDPGAEELILEAKTSEAGGASDNGQVWLMTNLLRRLFLRASLTRFGSGSLPCSSGQALGHRPMMMLSEPPFNGAYW